MKTTESRRLLREGKLAERAGNMQEAKGLYRQGLILDPGASQADWDLLQESPAHFRERRAIYSLLAIRVEDMARSVYAEAKAAKDLPKSKPLAFMYWGQGFDAAPPIVQACYQQAARMHRADEIVFLDNSNLHDWVELSPTVMHLLQTKRAHFSDVLRIELLAKHGGVWLDSTCLSTQGMQAVFPDLVRGSGFFAFGKDKPGVISNWFLASEPGNYVTLMLRDALRLYYGAYDKPIMYFFMHQIFLYLTRLDDRFGRLWDKTTVMAADPRGVNRALLKDVSEVDLEAMLAGSFVHKLTHKNKPEMITASTVQQALVDRFVQVA